LRHHAIGWKVVDLMMIVVVVVVVVVVVMSVADVAFIYE
jgi:hypothetical protein